MDWVEEQTKFGLFIFLIISVLMSCTQTREHSTTVIGMTNRHHQAAIKHCKKSYDEKTKRTNYGIEDTSCFARSEITTIFNHPTSVQTALEDVLTFEKMNIESHRRSGNEVTLDLTSTESVTLAKDFMPVATLTLRVTVVDRREISFMLDVAMSGTGSSTFKAKNYNIHIEKEKMQKEVSYRFGLTRVDWRPEDLFQLVAPRSNLLSTLHFADDQTRQLIDLLKIEGVNIRGAFSPRRGLEVFLSSRLRTESSLHGSVVRLVYALVQWYQESDKSTPRAAIMLLANHDSAQTMAKKLFGTILTRQLSALGHLLPHGGSVLASISSGGFAIVNDLQFKNDTDFHVTNSTLEKIPSGTSLLYGLNIKDRFKSATGKTVNNLPVKGSFRMIASQHKLGIVSDEPFERTVLDFIHFVSGSRPPLSSIPLGDDLCYLNQLFITTNEDMMTMRVNLSRNIVPMPGVLELHDLQVKYTSEIQSNNVVSTAGWRVTIEGKQEFLGDQVAMEINHDTVTGDVTIGGHLRIFNLTELRNRTGDADRNWDRWYQESIYKPILLTNFIGLRFTSPLTRQTDHIKLTGQAKLFDFENERVEAYFYKNSNNETDLYFGYMADNVYYNTFVNNITNSTAVTSSWLKADKILAALITGSGTEERDVFDGDLRTIGERNTWFGLQIYGHFRGIPGCNHPNNPTHFDNCCTFLKQRLPATPFDWQLYSAIKSNRSDDPHSANERLEVEIIKGTFLRLQNLEFTRNKTFSAEGYLDIDNKGFTIFTAKILQDTNGFPRLYMPPTNFHINPVFDMDFIRAQYSISFPLPIRGIGDKLDMNATLKIGYGDSLICKVRIIYNGTHPKSSIMYGHSSVNNLATVILAQPGATVSHWLSESVTFPSGLDFTFNGRNDDVYVDSLTKPIQPGCKLKGSAVVDNEFWNVTINLMHNKIEAKFEMPTINSSNGKYLLSRYKESYNDGPVTIVVYEKHANGSTTFTSSTYGYLRTFGVSGWVEINEISDKSYETFFTHVAKPKLFETIPTYALITSEGEKLKNAQWKLSYHLEFAVLNEQVNIHAKKRLEYFLKRIHNAQNSMDTTIKRGHIMIRRFNNIKTSNRDKVDILERNIAKYAAQIKTKMNRIENDCSSYCKSDSIPWLTHSHSCMKRTSQSLKCLKWKKTLRVANVTCMADCEGKKVLAYIEADLISKGAKKSIKTLEKASEKYSESLAKTKTIHKISQAVQKLKQNRRTLIRSFINIKRSQQQGTPPITITRLSGVQSNLNDIGQDCFGFHFNTRATVFGRSVSPRIRLCTTQIALETSEQLLDDYGLTLQRVDDQSRFDETITELERLLAEFPDQSNEAPGKRRSTKKSKIEKKPTHKQNAYADFAKQVVLDKDMINKQTEAFHISQPKTRGPWSRNIMKNYAPWSFYNDNSLLDYHGDLKRMNIKRKWNNTFGNDSNSCQIQRAIVERYQDLSDTLAHNGETYFKGKKMVEQSHQNMETSVRDLIKHLKIKGESLNATKAEMNDILYWAKYAEKGLKEWRNKADKTLDNQNRGTIPMILNNLSQELDHGEGKKFETLNDYGNYLSSRQIDSSKRSFETEEFDTYFTMATKQLGMFLKKKDLTLDDMNSLAASDVFKSLRGFASVAPIC